MRLQFHFRRTELEDPRWGLLSRSESPGWHRMMLRLNHGEVYFPGIERCSAWRSLVLGGPVGCLGLKMHCRPACRGHRHLSLGTTRPPHRATLRNMRKRRKKRQKSPQREREPCGKVLNWCFHIFCYIRDLFIFPHYLKICYHFL